LYSSAHVFTANRTEDLIKNGKYFLKIDFLDEAEAGGQFQGPLADYLQAQSFGMARF